MNDKNRKTKYMIERKKAESNKDMKETVFIKLQRM